MIGKEIHCTLIVCLHICRRISNLGGAVTFLLEYVRRSGEQSEKLLELPIVLSGKLPKCSRFLLRLLPLPLLHFFVSPTSTGKNQVAAMHYLREVTLLKDCSTGIMIIIISITTSSHFTISVLEETSQFLPLLPVPFLQTERTKQLHNCNKTDTRLCGNWSNKRQPVTEASLHMPLRSSF